MFGCREKAILRYTKSPMYISPLTEIWESPRAKENLTSAGFEPTTSGLHLPMLYRLSYDEAGTMLWVQEGTHLHAFTSRVYCRIFTQHVHYKDQPL